MDNLNRRDALKVGGMLAGIGALSLSLFTAPPRAQAWSWSASGSIAGSGDGVDPMTVWDPAADQVIAEVLESGQVPAINKILATWTTNNQPTPSGLPPNLTAFIEQARQLPAWIDQSKLTAADDFNSKQGPFIGTAYGFGAGLLATVIPHESRAVYYSNGGGDLQDRIAKTAKLGYDLMAQQPFAPNGHLIVTCVKTRMVHAAVRHLLPKSAPWLQVATESPKIPISQNDILVTWHSLPTTIMQKLKAWKVPITDAQSAGLLHSWQVTAHLLGVQDQYIPATWDSANAQSKQVLDPVLGPTPEGTKIADHLLTIGPVLAATSFITKPMLASFTKFVLGAQVAKWLNLKTDAIWDGIFATLWGPFVQLYQFGRIVPGVDFIYFQLTEFIKVVALLYLNNGGLKLELPIPTTNNPSIPGTPPVTTTPYATTTTTPPTTTAPATTTPHS
ncbi:oxygenase MpaB family protein [Nocardia sp. XZ_19_231]|uniref:oxygenase MpaB family protein n=1 Tax=Nocardia sp. XZ_19_231 TaxID=2769252 RepID=UPI00188E607B|nr:oxygenase MpaB family protein [Nocardia sp. XZ_19_231]